MGKKSNVAWETRHFNVGSEELVISDPCYSKDVWCMGTVKAKNGKWFPEVVQKKLEMWGNRIWEIEAYHEDYYEASGWKELDIDVGVDSGQCGIFDAEKYPEEGSEDEEFYDECCSLTLSHYSWGNLEFGTVASSGIGDGSYKAYACFDGDEAVKVKIVFISEDWLEEDNE